MTTAQRFAPATEIRAALPLAAGLQALLAAGLCGFALALLLLPQRILQRPLSQGVISLHLAADGQLRLWHQPVRRPELTAFLKATAQRRPGSRLRVIPDPQVNWGRLRRLLRELEAGPRPLELQLPPAPAAPSNPSSPRA
jgi:hypothetical protein